jgi:hypothetical protein
MAKKRTRKSASKGSSRRSELGYWPWPFWPLDPKLRDATARLIMSRAESWGKTFAAMADIANQMEEEWRKAGGRASRTRRRADDNW